MQKLRGQIDSIKAKIWFRLVLLWAMAITVISCIPGHELPESKLLEYDKIGHLTAYAILSFLLFIWIGKQYSRNTKVLKLYVVAIITGSVLGLILELIQGHLLTGRYFDLMDVIANIMGCIVGAVFASIVIKR